MENFSTRRLMKNSAYLYGRMLFTMWINLYTTRLILRNLGADDFGTYSIVGSIVGLFSILSMGVTKTVQRFISFEVGRKSNNFNQTFCTIVNIIFVIAALTMFILEILGMWFLQTKANIPEVNQELSVYIFHLSVLSSLFTLLGIPYLAVIITYERMNEFAIISIIQVVLYFFSAWLLSYIGANRLLWYSIFMFTSIVVIQLIYYIYCYFKFPETKYHRTFNKGVIKDVLKFASVSMLDGLMTSLSSQSLIMILNNFYGVAVNAVYTISLQLRNSILSFAQNIVKAVEPQITKTYAGEEYNTYSKLVLLSSKLQLFMISFIFYPTLLRMKDVLRIWLGNIPQYLIFFSQCSIIISLLYSSIEPLKTGVIATGKIARFYILPDTIFLMIIPLSIIFCSFFDWPYLIPILEVFIHMLICIMRIFIIPKETLFNRNQYFREIIVPYFFISIILILIGIIFNYFFNINYYGLLIYFIVNAISLIILSYFVWLNKEEKIIVCSFVKKMLVR